MQDQLRANGKDIADLIHHRNAVIYVCGDIKVMVRDVRETIAEILKENFGLYCLFSFCDIFNGILFSFRHTEY